VSAKQLKYTLSFLWICLSVSSTFAQGLIITTYAGPPLPVDGASALTQLIGNPISVAPDGSGGFYFISGLLNRIYQVYGNGIIHEIRGTLPGAYPGAGPSTLPLPGVLLQGLAVDAARNLYYSDAVRNQVGKVTPDGTVTVVAGTGVPGFSGDGGPATQAQLQTPDSVAVDASGNLYISDNGNLRLRKVTPDGRINTIAGNGLLSPNSNGDGRPAISATYSGEAITVDGMGDILIAVGLSIRKITPDGIIQTVAGQNFPHIGYGGEGGPAIDAFISARGVSVDGYGNIFIADYDNDGIREVTADGLIHTVAGHNGPTATDLGDGGPAKSATLLQPLGLAFDALGNLYIADSANGRVRMVDSNGIIHTLAGMGVLGPFRGYAGDGGPATSAQLNIPKGSAIDRFGNLYIADSGNNLVRKVSLGGTISTFAGNGTQGFSGDGGPATSAMLSGTLAVATDASGNLYIADNGNNRIRKVTPGGTITTSAGTGVLATSGDGGPATSAALYGVTSLTVDSSGTVYLTDSQSQIRKITPQGTITTIANLKVGLSGIAVDANGNLYVSGGMLNVVQKIVPSGAVTNVAGATDTGGFSGDGGAATSAQLNNPVGVAVDAAGNIYIADSGNNRIRKVTTDGLIQTVAGSGFEPGFSGDGGPATSAELNSPEGVTVDAVGNLYIADTSNGRIRKFGNTPLPLFIATASPLPFALVGTAYSQTLSAGGGTLPYTRWAISSGSLPSGLALNPASGTITGNISGTSGVFSFTVGVTDSAGVTATATFQITVTTPLTITTSPALSSGVVGTPYSQIFTAGGGIAPYSQWVVTAGTLPPGLSLSATTGSLSGKPTALSGTFSFTVTVTDANGATASQAFQLAIQAPTGSAPLTRIGSFAQLASGGGWTTTITLINLSAATVNAQINFYSTSGSALVLPITFSQFGITQTTASAAITLSPSQSVVVQSQAAGSTVNVGWIDVQGTGPLDGYSIFGFSSPGNPFSEGTATFDSSSSPSFVLPYDETNGFRTGFAIANQAGATAFVTATVMDGNGVQIGSTRISLPAMGHISMYVDELMNGITNQNGIVQFQSSYNVTAVGLRFSPAGSFTSIPIIR
jgi:trimeric autotransporter adhesin